MDARLKAGHDASRIGIGGAVDGLGGFLGHVPRAPQKCR
jgi:hypothetical protein